MYIHWCYNTFICRGFIEMKNILVVTGHGRYATSIKSTLEVLAGCNDEVKYIDFTEDDTDISLKDKMQIVIYENIGFGILFVCDLLGGTPFKSAVELSILNENIEVVAGCNVGSILETTFQLENTVIGELADLIVESSINSTLRFKKNNFQIKEEDLESELGI